MTSSIAFRILTFNLLHDPVSWPNRAPLVEAELFTIAPDVALFQEVAWPNEQVTNLAAALEERTGQPYSVFLTAVLVPGRWQEGLVVIGRFPILETEEPKVADAVHVCQRVRFDVDDHTVDVYNMHLDPWSKYHSAQLAALLTLVEDYPDVAGVILGGDLNATPDSDAVKLVARQVRSAYAVVHGREPNYTMPTPLDRSREQLAKHPVNPQTVDYLFVSPHIDVINAELAFANPAAHNPGLYPSDHYGIFADLRF